MAKPIRKEAWYPHPPEKVWVALTDRRALTDERDRPALVLDVQAGDEDDRQRHQRRQVGRDRRRELDHATAALPHLPLLAPRAPRIRRWPPRDRARRPCAPAGA